MILKGYLQNYYEYCKRYIEQNEMDKKSLIERTDKELKPLEKKILKGVEDRERILYLKGRKDITEKGLKEIIKCKENLKKFSIANDYHQLKKHSLIKKVGCEKTLITVITKKLKVFNKDIGYYEMRLPFEGSIRIRNLEKKVNGILDHWFIRNGDPCLSEWMTATACAFDKGNLYLAIDNLIQFLLSTGYDGHMNPEIWMGMFNGEIEENEAEELEMDGVRPRQVDPIPAVRVYSGTSTIEPGTVIPGGTIDPEQGRTAGPSI